MTAAAPVYTHVEWDSDNDNGKKVKTADGAITLSRINLSRHVYSLNAYCCTLFSKVIWLALDLVSG